MSCTDLLSGTGSSLTTQHLGAGLKGERGQIEIAPISWTYGIVTLPPTRGTSPAIRAGFSEFRVMGQGG